MATSNQTRNAYSILGLHKGATEDEIKLAYVNLVKRYDPEVHTDRFMVIQGAFDRLKDPQKRAREDVLTFNFIRADYTFSKEEKVDVPDAKLAQAVELLEQKHKNEPEARAENAPKLLQGFMIRSYKNVQRNLVKEAIEDWLRVLEIEPTHHRAKSNLLYAYSKLGLSYANHTLFDEAIELWERAARMNPDSHAVLQNLALACERSGRMDEARRYWDEAIRRWKQMLDREPDDEYLKSIIIEAMRHMAEWAETSRASAPPPSPRESTSPPPGIPAQGSAPRPAPSPQQPGAPQPPRPASKPAPAAIDEVEQCKEIIKLRPDDYDANLRLANALMNQKRWPEAVAQLNEIHRKFPRNIEVLNSLGWAQMNNQEVDGAFRSWERGLKLDPKNFTIRESIIKARMQMGRALREKNMFINAIVHFKALAKFIPDSDEVHFELGRTYQLKGDIRSAYVEYQQVLKLNPKHKTARGALSELKLSRA